MNIKQFLSLMIIGTILCWAMFLLVIFNIPPENGYISLIFFYLSLFLALLGNLAILGLGIRMRILKKEIVFKEVKNSFRQSLLLSVLIISALFLESKNNLAWWNLLLLIIALTVLECLFSSTRKTHISMDERH
ncbi:MAG: hypothetical protein V1655_01230 [bacterium]